jgi:hypothetical protein
MHPMFTAAVAQARQAQYLEEAQQARLRRLARTGRRIRSSSGPTAQRWHLTIWRGRTDWYAGDVSCAHLTPDAG